MHKLMIFLVLIFLYPLLVFAQFPTEWGVVKKGTFVIPSNELPWTDPEGRSAGKRIGYMRVGTVVRVGACTHVNGPDDDSTGMYCNVESEVGVEGKALASRIFPLERGKTFAIARKEVVLYDRINISVPREKFSRNAGVIVQLIGDWHSANRNEAIDVIATYNLERPNSLTEVAVLKSDLVKNTYVIQMPIEDSLSPRKFERERTQSGEWVLSGGAVSLWSIKPALGTTAIKLSKQVFSDIGWDEGTTEEAENLLSKAFEITTSVLDKLRCVTDISADVSAGFEFLGNGLKLNGKIPVYNKGKLFDFDVDVVERNGIAQFWILTAKTVVCAVGEGVVDSEPRLVERVLILSIKRKSPEGAPARLTVDYAKRWGLSIPDAVDSNNVPRLFVIGEFRDYIAARSLVAKRITNSGLIDHMNRKERILLQHAMIAKLGEFERRALTEDLE
jgi:hypothetical protein